MKRGKLSNVEKMAIQGGLGNGQSSEEIAEALDRSLASVDKYINNDLDKIHSTIAKAKLEQKEEVEQEETVKYEPVKDKRRSKPTNKDIAEVRPTDTVDTIDSNDIVERDVVLRVYRQLRDAGLTENDSNQVIHSAIDRAAKDGQTFKTVGQLFTACVKRMSAGHFIQKVTEGGSEGVAIMSGAASMRSDEARKSQKSTSRSARGNVFNPSTGEYL